jgi:hydrogenase expression/formation protein HypE
MIEPASDIFGMCLLPIADHPAVTMAHGGGGRIMRRLIETMFAPALTGARPDALHDGAILEVGGARLAFTTDSYVVHPLRFPGGDIGTLAVNGTVNDLAMCGARPLFLSSSFLLEEGLPMTELWATVQSMQRAACAAGVQFVTGDTKVVDRGKGDGLFVNTAGIGVIERDLTIGPGCVQPGDAVLLSGDIGRHGIAIMAVREGLEFESTIESDCAPLAAPVLALLDSGIEIHCLRDLTRGGLASALVEIADSVRLYVEIREDAIPIEPMVQGACEILGFDPLYVANEGRFVCILPSHEADRALDVLRRFPVTARAVKVGKVEEAATGLVTLHSRIGASRIVDMLSGEQLPRIC